MMPFSNTKSDGTSQTITHGNAYVNGAGYATFLWCATSRDNNINIFGGTEQAPTYDASTRTASTCYIRGVKENLRFQTNTGIPWLWRRIVFSHRGPSPFNTLNSSDTPVQSYSPTIDTSVGPGRVWMNQAVNAMTNTTTSQYGLLFKGTLNKDYEDVFTAAIDTTRVDLKSDKTVRISSGNANGIFREYKRWYPVNKNLVYGDVESGDNTSASSYSVADKRGCGDIYIMDIIQAGTGATSSDLIQIGSNTTLYWHEK